MLNCSIYSLKDIHEMQILYDETIHLGKCFGCISVQNSNRSKCKCLRVVVDYSGNHPHKSLNGIIPYPYT